MDLKELDFQRVLDTYARIKPYFKITCLREYKELNEWIGNDIRILVKHENHLPTNAFKLRNALSVLTGEKKENLTKGVVAATRGNHGLGVAYAGKLLGVPVTICVPRGNNPEKNSGIRALGAKLIETGDDYDQSIETMQKMVAEEGLYPVYGASCINIIAGAATLTLEIVEQSPDFDAMVISVGGGSQASGAVWVKKHFNRDFKIFGVQAEGAPAMHDSWHAGEKKTSASAKTIADGLATRGCYDLTFKMLRQGLEDFITVSDEEIAESMRVLLKMTHNLVEGAGAAGLAGLYKMRERLRGQKVAVILSGGNVDQETLRKVLAKEPLSV